MKRAALTLLATCLGGIPAAHAWEPRLNSDGLASVPLHFSHDRREGVWEITDWRRVGRFSDGLGLRLTLPLRMSPQTTARVCAAKNPERLRGLFELGQRNYAVMGASGVQSVGLDLDPVSGIFALNVVAFPLVGKDRLREPIRYHYPLLDPLTTRCVPGKAYNLDIAVYLDGYNTVVSAKRSGDAFGPVFVSPVNAAVGPLFMTAVAHGYSDIYMRGMLQEGSPTRVGLAAFDWEKFKTQYQLYYGGRSIPRVAAYRDASVGTDGLAALLFDR